MARRSLSGFLLSIAMLLGSFAWTGITLQRTIFDASRTGAIVGVGSSQKFSAVRWGLAGSIVWAWVITIPASAIMAAIGWWIGSLIL